MFLMIHSCFILFIITSASCFCPHGYFSYNGTKCLRWLVCKDLFNLTLGDLIGFGAVKKVYRSTWQELPIAVVFINNPQYTPDFHHGLNMLIRLNPNKYIVSLIGYCKESNVYITKYYPHGSLIHFKDYLPTDPISNFKARYKLCLSYIEIVAFIHTIFETPAVMCDSNTLNKTLEQYLLEDSQSIVLNDIDALTETKNKGLVCGHKEIGGNFVAPEQLWPFEERYNETRMPLYDEKTDIWKIPSICRHIIGDSKESRNLEQYLFDINKACRQINPKLRPNASVVLERYSEIYNIFYSKDEL